MKEKKVRYCTVCGKELPSNAGNNRKYCSEACIRKHESHKYGERIANRAGNINKVAHLVYKAYECKCALCGWQATADIVTYKGKIQYAHGNEIHHITQISDGGEENPHNIILLCPNHHKQADLGLISTEELRKHTKNFRLTPEDIEEAKLKCADIIAQAIF